MSKTNPLQTFTDSSDPFIIDGGLATELEKRGHDLSDELWSARLLMDAPEVIRQVHYDYLEAGADGLITASYQGTIPGFMRKGFTEKEAEQLLILSVTLALEARERFWSNPDRRLNRKWPIVAASVGPYGAHLADGSEFTGTYDLDEDGLMEFHRRRWEILAASQADVLACETIPSFAEGRVFIELFRQTSGRYGWMSFSCKDGEHISDGTPISKIAEIVDPVENVTAIGVNCTAPQYIDSLIHELKRSTNKPIVVYPNSGEIYDAELRRWTGESNTGQFAEACLAWRSAGATMIGGCCRTGPEHIRLIRQRLAS